MAQRALEQIHAQTAGRVLQLGRELKVRGSRARAVGATRRHNQQRQQQRENNWPSTLSTDCLLVLCCASSADPLYILSRAVAVVAPRDPPLLLT